VRRVALVLGKQEDANRFGALFEKIRTAFQREFVTGLEELVRGRKQRMF
jgi:hypothetical protein